MIPKCEHERNAHSTSFIFLRLPSFTCRSCHRLNLIWLFNIQTAVKSLLKSPNKFEKAYERALMNLLLPILAPFQCEHRPYRAKTVQRNKIQFHDGKCEFSTRSDAKLKSVETWNVIETSILCVRQPVETTTENRWSRRRIKRLNTLCLKNRKNIVNNDYRAFAYWDQQVPSEREGPLPKTQRRKLFHSIATNVGANGSNRSVK